MSNIIYKSGILLTKDCAYQFVQYKETDDELWLDYTDVRPECCYKIRKSDIIKIFDSYKQFKEYLIGKH